LKKSKLRRQELPVERDPTVAADATAALRACSAVAASSLHKVAFSLEGIDHVALLVRDVERSRTWYQDVLGLERRHERAWEVPVMVGTGTSCVALFAAPEGSAPAPPGAIAMAHLAFRVDRAGFEAAKQDLTAREIDWELQDHDIAHSIYFTDPDGHRLEITTYEL
jgi:catechol 2,3-dioxygenase-like lactoylglutathione lyase family enzyme